MVVFLFFSRGGDLYALLKKLYLKGFNYVCASSKCLYIFNVSEECCDKKHSFVLFISFEKSVIESTGSQSNINYAFSPHMTGQ